MIDVDDVELDMDVFVETDVFVGVELDRDTFLGMDGVDKEVKVASSIASV